MYMDLLDRVCTVGIHACSCKHGLCMLIHLVTLHYVCADIQRLASVSIQTKGRGGITELVHVPTCSEVLD